MGKASLEEFLKSVPTTGKKHHDFTKSLNARERLIVHEICESDLKLKSESQGEGKKRFVRVLAPDALLKQYEEEQEKSAVVNNSPELTKDDAASRDVATKKEKTASS